MSSSPARSDRRYRLVRYCFNADGFASSRRGARATVDAGSTRKRHLGARVIPCLPPPSANSGASSKPSTPTSPASTTPSPASNESQAKLKAYRASVLKAAVEGRLVPTEASLARAEKRDYEPAEVAAGPHPQGTPPPLGGSRTRQAQGRRKDAEGRQVEGQVRGAGRPGHEDAARASRGVVLGDGLSRSRRSSARANALAEVSQCGRDVADPVSSSLQRDFEEPDRYHATFDAKWTSSPPT